MNKLQTVRKFYPMRDVGLQGLAIRVLNDAIEENPCHSNGTTREVWVVVQTLTDFNAGRRIDIASEEGLHIILDKNQSVSIHLTNNHNMHKIFAENGESKSEEYKESHTAPPCRALIMRLKSGGRAPPLLARAASSLGYGAGR